MNNSFNFLCDTYNSAAVLSEDGLYRNLLLRALEGDLEEKIVLYIGINPSTADASIDDATVRKWKGFTRVMGCKVFLVVNLFAYRATDVRELKKVEDPVGPDNDWYIREALEKADLVVPCWGNSSKVPKELAHRVQDVEALLRECGKPVKCFGKTKSGDPKHSLMLSYSTPIEDYFQPLQPLRGVI